MTARSYLFVPGDRADMLAKAPGRGADAIIADLEDAVAPSQKAAARTIVADWLENAPGDHVEVWVRVNPGERQAGDIAAVEGMPITGIMVPKVSSADDVARAVEALDHAELTDAAVLPIIETPSAVLSVAEIAAAPRVHQLMIGEMDLGALLGIHHETLEAWHPIRLQLVVASAAAGIAGPLGPVDADFDDLDRLFEETRALYRIGFRSRPAIHPAQVPIYNEALSPSEDEIEEARRIVEQFDAAVAEGAGAITDDRGRMIDEAVVKVARATLEAARRRA